MEPGSDMCRGDLKEEIQFVSELDNENDKCFFLAYISIWTE